MRKLSVHERMAHPNPGTIEHPPLNLPFTLARRPTQRRATSSLIVRVYRAILQRGNRRAGPRFDSKTAPPSPSASAIRALELVVLEAREAGPPDLHPTQPGARPVKRRAGIEIRETCGDCKYRRASFPFPALHRQIPSPFNWPPGMRPAATHGRACPREARLRSARITSSAVTGSVPAALPRGQQRGSDSFLWHLAGAGEHQRDRQHAKESIISQGHMPRPHRPGLQFTKIARQDANGRRLLHIASKCESQQKNSPLGNGILAHAIIQKRISAETRKTTVARSAWMASTPPPSAVPYPAPSSCSCSCSCSCMIMLILIHLKILILIKVKVVDIIDIHLGLGSAWAP
ncbi:hypothetical protein V8E36_000999 [Tilletia maclaganii]